MRKGNVAFLAKCFAVTEQERGKTCNRRRSLPTTEAGDTADQNKDGNHKQNIFVRAVEDPIWTNEH